MSQIEAFSDTPSLVENLLRIAESLDDGQDAYLLREAATSLSGLHDMATFQFKSCPSKSTPIERSTRRVFIGATFPKFTYIFRRWLLDGKKDKVGQQSDVVIITSDVPMKLSALFDELQQQTHYAKDYVMVDAPTNSTMVLDTYEPSVNGRFEKTQDPNPFKHWKNWWSEKDRELISEEEMQAQAKVC